MKKLLIIMGIAGAMVLVSGSMSYSQSLIKKLKKKAEEQLIEKAFEDKKGSQNENQEGYHGVEEESQRSSVHNTRGSGLDNKPPDVQASISEAEATFSSKEYSQTRNSIRKAILGIEMEIGKQILADLPENIDKLTVNEDLDKLTSTSIGFVGLTIERVYQGGDQELRLTIGNDAAMLSAVNMYMGTTTYETSTDENRKQIDYKGYNSVLEYDDASGYTLSVPFGQSSIMILNGINFANEQEMMKAAEIIDIERIKKQLGEK